LTVDKRFALIDSDGYRRYPYLSQNGFGGYGFVIGRSANSRHTASIEEVIRAVVMDGESMRAKALEGPHANQGNSVKLHAKRKIVGFYVAPELVYLVEGAPVNVARIPGDGGPQTSDRQTVVDERLNHLKVSDVTASIRELQAFITPSLREVLEEHAGAPDHRGRIADLAHNIDPSREEEIRSIYEAFSLAIADELGISGTTGLETLAFGNDAGRDSVWVLRPQVLAALKETGTIESDETAPASGALADDPQFLSATPTVRRALVNARVGQGGYRKRMLALWGNRCAVTGCKVEKALIASHAKAWSVSTNEERLDEFNGLLLSASLDRLFDSGLIAFANDGRLLCSSILDDADLSALGLGPDSSLRKVHPRHCAYLAAHREQFGFE
jgi:hypothetical protein